LDWSVCLTRSTVETELRAITLGRPLLDDYLAFVGARARPNTWLAVVYDPLSEGRLGGRRHPHLTEQQAELECAP
jgi:hypothetical protein